MKSANKLSFSGRFGLARRSPKKIGLFLIFCLCLLPVSVAAQADDGQATAELENTAQILSKQWSGDAMRRSISLFSEAARRREAARDVALAAENWREAARLDFLLGNYKQALSKLRNALKIETADNHPSGRVKTLSRLVFLSLETDKLKEGKNYLKQAENLIESADDAAARAIWNYARAEFYQKRRDFTPSLDFYQKSIDLWKETGNIRDEAYTLVDYGYAYLPLGESVTGLHKIEEAEAKFQQIEDARGLAVCRIARGHLNNMIGRKQLALESYQKAAEAFPDDIEFLEKARLYNGIGYVYEDYREWNLSLDYRLKAIELFRRQKYLFGQLATLPSLVRLNFLLHDDAAAAEYFLATQKLSARLEDTYFLAITRGYIADIQFENGEYAQALANYSKSLKTLEAKPFKMEVAHIRDKLGGIYERAGDFPKAKSYYESSLKISRNIQHKFLEAQTTYNLARLSHLENKNDEALRLISQSIEITEHLASDFSNSKVAGNYFSGVFERYEFYINLLMKMHRESPQENYAVLALQAAENSRARSLRETLSLSEADFIKDADAETVKHEREIRGLLSGKADKLTDLLSDDKSDKAEIAKITGEINDLKNELAEIKARLKESSPVYSTIKNPAPFDVGEFQNQILDENSLLLEFSFGAEESYLWLVGKNEIDSYALAPRAQIENRIETLRALLASREIKQDEAVEDYQKRINEAEKAFEQEALALSEMLFGQIAGKLSNKRLIIVPDGKLHYFPVSALSLPNAENGAPILWTNETVYEPSAQTLSLLKKSRKDSPAAKNFLVFSDPVFSNDDARLSGADKTPQNAEVELASTGRLRSAASLSSLQRLTASKDEADSIIEITGGSPEDSFSGFRASREQLLSANISDYKIIHFATHGLVNEQRPELSGIVLSRFDQDGRQIDESIRLHDIYGLNLNADLIVLSACNTGFGSEVKGEGLLSLNNAFLQVGAKSVVSSLWKVDDDATKELMKDFYQNLTSKKLTSSEALRQAQIKLSQNRKYKSPFFWAAFTLQGDFESTPKLSQNFGYWIYFLLIIPFLTFGVYRFGKAGLFNRKIVSRR